MFVVFCIIASRSFTAVAHLLKRREISGASKRVWYSGSDSVWALDLTASNWRVSEPGTWDWRHNSVSYCSPDDRDATHIIEQLQTSYRFKKMTDKLASNLS